MARPGDTGWVGSLIAGDSVHGFRDSVFLALAATTASRETPGLFASLDPHPHPPSSAPPPRPAAPPHRATGTAALFLRIPAFFTRLFPKWALERGHSALELAAAVCASLLVVRVAGHLLGPRNDDTATIASESSSMEREDDIVEEASGDAQPQNAAAIARALERTMRALKAQESEADARRADTVRSAGALVDALEHRLAVGEAASPTRPAATPWAEPVHDTPGGGDLGRGVVVQRMRRRHAALSKHYRETAQLVSALAEVVGPAVEEADRAMDEAMRTLRGALAEFTEEGTRQVSELVAVVQGRAEVGARERAVLPNSPYKQFATSLERLRERIRRVSPQVADAPRGHRWPAFRASQVATEPDEAALVLRDLSLLVAAYDNLGAEEDGVEAIGEVTANAGALLRLALAAKNTLRGLPTRSPTASRVLRRTPPAFDAEAAGEGDEPVSVLARRLLRKVAEVPDTEALEKAGVLTPTDET